MQANRVEGGAVNMEKARRDAQVRRVFEMNFYALLLDLSLVFKGIVSSWRKNAWHWWVEIQPNIVLWKLWSAAPGVCRVPEDF